MEPTGGAAFPKVGQLPYLLTLQPYGFLWFQLAQGVDAPEWATSAPGVEIEHHTFVLRPDLDGIVDAANRFVLERDVLPDYIAHRRWFGARTKRLLQSGFCA